MLGLGITPPASPREWDPPDPAELHRLLPQYRIEGILGRGGMGVVYKGSQEKLQRAVAIKLLPAELAANPEFITRFEREACTLARLYHPNILQIHESGRTSEGHLYFVMEFIDGTDLQRMLRDGPLDPALTLDIISQVCAALQFAHSQGVVHRDIKPANLLITRDGVVKLADFGLARPLNPDGISLTMTQRVMGTPDYMAPEQKQGSGDHRVDLFALGVMLYEMLCGKLPQGAWQPPSQRVKIDRRLDRIVEKAMQNEPSRRYQQASAVKTDIDKVRDTVATPGLNKSAWMMAASTLTVVVGTCIWWSRADRVTSAVLPAEPPVALADTSATHPWLNSLGLGFVPLPDSRTLLCTTEARESDWAEFLKATGYSWQRFRDPTVSDTPKPPDHPASGISWHDACAFCDWLTETERRKGKIGTDKHYRLPTDREWSLAAGQRDPADLLPSHFISTNPVFEWGFSWPPPVDRMNVGDVGPSPTGKAPVLVDAYPETCPVTAFAPNVRGLYGLTGNVAEWTASRWTVGHSEDGFRVTRGGGWFTPAQSGMPWLMKYAGNEAFRMTVSATKAAAKCLDLAERQYAQPGERWPHLGFRPALTPADEPAPSPPLTPIIGPVIVNSLGMQMVVANGVETQELFLSRWETRVRDYRTFANETNRPIRNISFTQGPNHPALMVSQEDCEAFCRWLTEKERSVGIIPTGLIYRLPESGEWFSVLAREAVKGGGYVGFKVFPAQTRENLFDLSRSAVLGAGAEGKALVYNDGYPFTAPVGSYLPTLIRGFPFMDIGGNVIERQISPRLFAGSRETGNAVYGHSYASAIAEPATDVFPHWISDEPSEEIGFRVVLGKPLKPHFLTKTEVLEQSKTYAGHTYAWVVSAAPHEDAATFARSIGGHLATVDDDAEREFLSRDGQPGVWLTGEVKSPGQAEGFIIEFDTAVP